MTDGPTPHAGGRPTIFDQELVGKILDRISDGESLRKICCDDAMPGQTTVYRWLRENEEFRQQYASARELQADTLFDETLDIADDATNDWMERHAEGSVSWKENGEAIRRSQLRIDTRKWMAGKLKPKKYGDKTLVGSDPDNPLPPGLADMELARLITFQLTKSTRG